MKLIAFFDIDGKSGNQTFKMSACSTKSILVKIQIELLITSPLQTTRHFIACLVSTFQNCQLKQQFLSNVTSSLNQKSVFHFCRQTYSVLLELSYNCNR